MKIQILIKLAKIYEIFEKRIEEISDKISKICRLFDRLIIS